MDDSMDDTYDDLPTYSLPSSSRRPVGLGIDPPPPSSTLPDPADVYHSHADHHIGHQPRQNQRHASPGPDASLGSSAPGEAADRDEDDEDDDEDGNGEDEEEEEEGDGMSETSSAMYDPATDPEGFSRRLDELAGVLEVGEEEARAMRQGPMIGKAKKVSVLPLPDFKNYLNHYLAATEWKYTPPAHADSLLRRQGVAEVYQPGEDLGPLHPIRALGRSWVGREVGGEGMEMMEGLGISDGLPRMPDEGRVVVGLNR